MSDSIEDGRRGRADHDAHASSEADDAALTRRHGAGPASWTPASRDDGSLPSRYEDLDVIGRGGWGEIRRVRDRAMDRVVAMKLLASEHVASPGTLGRFLNEATITAALEHPGVVPVHDRGRLSDGRPWFTMKEVRGRTLSALLRSADPATEPSVEDPTRTRRLLEIFARICETVGYAHQRDVVHRDLKPSNVMVGEFGEVLVLDWGVARRRGERPLPASEGEWPMSPEGGTASGDVLGTVNYMSPEQARGANDLVDPRSDVFSLGLVLFEILVGRPGRSGGAMRAWVEAAGAVVPEITGADRARMEISEELIELYERAAHREPEQRFASGKELAEAVRAWLDGAARRERAERATATADLIAPHLEALRAERDALRSKAGKLLAELQPHDPSEAKAPAWRIEDEAIRVEQDIALAEVERIETLRGALEHDPQYLPAHARLATLYRARVLEAEAKNASADAARFEMMLRRHDRGEHARFLAGQGWLELDSAPSGARARVLRFEPDDRRLVERETGIEGATPLSCELKAGSYVVVLEREGLRATRYPVRIARDATWDATRPGASRPSPVRMLSALSADELHVPAGWADLGGDELAAEPVPATRVWIDDFVVRRFPITCAEYLAFLDATHATDAALALRHAPRWPRGAAIDEPLAAERVGDRFVMRIDAHGHAVDPEWPISLIDWRSAHAYAGWLAATTGLPWRLPNELEWEKAARGVDERPFAWGSQPEPTWARILGSTADAPYPVPVRSYPVDESPYGVRGMVGNVRDWCANAWAVEGPPIDGGVLRVDAGDPESTALRTIRGGAWNAVPDRARAAGRFAGRPDERLSGVGFRLVRSLER